MSELVVQKYGGSSLATPNHILSTAKNIQKLVGQGYKAIVVVSAMGSTTNELTELAYKISPKPKRREFDMLLSTGERVSMALLSMALHDLGVESISFTGSQAGVFTDSLHSYARIVDLKPIRVEQELSKGKVIVLAGFQGVDPETKEITTLGRGGSDTTAISMAAHFRATRCEMLKDVDGLLTGDPRFCNKTKLLPKVDYKTAENMCFWGSKVLHLRSISLAKQLNVPLFIGNSSTGKLGTEIGHFNKENSMFESDRIFSISHHSKIKTISINNSKLNEAIQSFYSDLNKNEIPIPQIIASAQDEKSRVMYTGDSELIESINYALRSNPLYSFEISDECSVTLHSSESATKNILNTCLKRLEELNIPTKKVLIQPSALTLVLDASHLESSLNALQVFIE